MSEFRWFFPPRSSSDFPPKWDSGIMKMWMGLSDSIAQPKANGTNIMLVVDRPKRLMEFWTRHKIDPLTGKDSPHGIPKQSDYVPPKPIADQVFDMSPQSLAVYNVELLHSKTTMVKNTLYFFDLLVWEGQHLIGVEYKERFGIVQGLLGERFIPLTLPRIDNQIYIANNIAPSEWALWWDMIRPCPYMEGLVLKREGAVSRLTYGSKMKNNDGFIARVRKPTKNMRY